MSDCMTFPDTVEEFMEQYKIIDTKQVYTNGAELVPIFRMKQWFEHLPSAQPEITLESAIDYLHSIGWMQEHDRILTESAQPEIIHCKECEYGVQGEDERWYCRWVGCQVGDEDGSGFCADAERRTDER